MYTKNYKCMIDVHTLMESVSRVLDIKSHIKLYFIDHAQMKSCKKKQQK